MKLITHLHLAQRLRMRGACPPVYMDRKVTVNLYFIPHVNVYLYYRLKKAVRIIFTYLLT
jgi:hypothetical protein